NFIVILHREECGVEFKLCQSLFVSMVIEWCDNGLYDSMMSSCSMSEFEAGPSNTPIKDESYFLSFMISICTVILMNESGNGITFGRMESINYFLWKNDNLVSNLCFNDFCHIVYIYRSVLISLFLKKK